MSTVDPNNIVLVYRTPNSVEARGTLANHLDDAGIESQVVGDFLDGAYAGLNLGGMGEKEVWVAEKDQAAAEAIIADWKQQLSSHNLVASPGSSTAYKVMLAVALLFLLLVGIGT